MLKTKLEMIAFLCLLPALLLAQELNIIEKSESEIYKISFDAPVINFNIKKLQNRNTISFPDFSDESASGEFILPKKDLFIAIPPNSNPAIQLNIINQEFIDAYPEINPLVKSVNGSLVVYQEVEMPVRINGSKNLKIKGKLWIGNSYCLHVQIKLYDFDSNNRRTIKFNKFELRLTFNSKVEFSNSTSKKLSGVNSLIINPKLAANYFGEPNFHVVDSDSWIDYTKDYLKIGTTKNSIYKITPFDLSSFKINYNSIDPKTFKLFKNGIEIPIYVNGEDDGLFNESDFIEFVGERDYGGHHREVSEYGKPYNEYLGRYTDTTIYWLTWNGDYGLRVPIISNNNLITQDTLKYYNEIIHLETNNWFDFSMDDLVRRETPFWYENKTWNEGNLSVGIRNKNFTLTDIYPNKPVKVFSKLQSYATNIIEDAHLLSISLNNEAVQDSGYISKYQKKVLTGEYNSNILNEGTNTLKLHSYSTAAFPNLCILDWYEIEYPRYLKANNDSLNFSFPYLLSSYFHSVKINNVTVDNFSIWKYGQLYSKYISQKINDEIVFNDTIHANDKFIILDENKLQSPKFYYAKKFVNLRSAQNKADYIAITHKKFLSQVNEYANFISENYLVGAAVIDVDDIYDEFSYGQFNPEDIREFLKATHNSWQQPVPKYAALIGGATYDYHRNKTTYQNVPPVNNYVPSFGVSVSDNWFVTWDTTTAYLPQMNVGRIPVTTNEEFARYFEKHRNFLSHKIDDWNKRFIFFSGGTGDNQNQLNQLREVNEYIINSFIKPPPISGSYTHFYKTINPRTNFGPYATEEVQSAIKAGGIFISYLGHSGTQTWDNSITEPSQLKNNINRNPFISDFGCSTARFAEPDITSFSELFLLAPEGQAIAYVGNSSLGFVSTSVLFPKIFYKKLLADSIYNISEALKLAKLEMLQQYGGSGVYQLFALTNTLIGDPIISLPLPNKPDLSITSSDVFYNSSKLSDQQDSVGIKILYSNYGLSTNDSMKIFIKDEFNGTINFSEVIDRIVPSLTDSFSINIPTNNLPGEHTLTVNLDNENSIDEINENNNSVSIKINISSSTLRTFFDYSVEQESNGKIKILNPTLNPINEKIILQFSKTKNFENPIEVNKSFDTVLTSVDINKLLGEGRYWFRGKLLDADDFNTEQSFYRGNKNRYLLNDSLSYSTALISSLKYLNNSIQLDLSNTIISVLSAGQSDGNSAIITKNGENYIPENTLQGHHVCVFEDSTFKFVMYKRFDVQQGAQAVSNYISFLDTISSKYLIAIGISDNGPISSPDLKNLLHSFGSIYIDSLVFRSSWAFIGKRGAAPGTMPEAYSKPFAGRVQIDTTINSILKSGYFKTSKVGPSSLWQNVEVQNIIPGDANFSIQPLGIKENGGIDTLENLTFTNNISDISKIDFKFYPYLEFVCKLNASSNMQSPKILSFAVEYKKSAELALNYQTVSVLNDSINAGEVEKLIFKIYNVGEVEADSFKVIVNVAKSDQSINKIFETAVSKLDTSANLIYNIDYDPGVKFGAHKFLISVDPENKIKERYKDNNNFEIPFYVIPDTTNLLISDKSFNVKYDGVDIVDGDYISSSPEIMMTLNYPLWYAVEDTSAIEFYLDNKSINNNTIISSIDISSRTITFTYKPLLTEGDHSFKVFGKNIEGDIETAPGYEKTFMVSNEMNLLQVYNFPNPFAEKTFFTFKLTQIPDELQLNIYTIAGRLIKKIERKSSQLNYDFNKIEWDGKDADGDNIANGAYLYKIIIKKGEKSQDTTQKLSIVR